jgi:hypothetical protein
VRSDSAKFFGYFLPKKVTTRRTRDQTLHSVCVTAWAVTPQCKLSRRTPVRRYSSTKVHEGHEGGICRYRSSCCRDMPPACPLCVCVALKLGLRSCWCRGRPHDTNTRCNEKKPAPAESAAVCGGKLQSKGLGFGADCRMPLGFTELHAPKPTARGAAIEACVPIPQVLWLLSSKESNNKNKHCTLVASRYGP